MFNLRGRRRPGPPNAYGPNGWLTVAIDTNRREFSMPEQWVARLRYGGLGWDQSVMATQEYCALGALLATVVVAG